MWKNENIDNGAREKKKKWGNKASISSPMYVFYKWNCWENQIELLSCSFLLSWREKEEDEASSDAVCHKTCENNKVYFLSTLPKDLLPSRPGVASVSSCHLVQILTANYWQFGHFTPLYFSVIPLSNKAFFRGNGSCNLDNSTCNGLLWIKFSFTLPLWGIKGSERVADCARNKKPGEDRLLGDLVITSSLEMSTYTALVVPPRQAFITALLGNRLIDLTEMNLLGAWQQMPCFLSLIMPLKLGTGAQELSPDPPLVFCCFTPWRWC